MCWKAVGLFLFFTSGRSARDFIWLYLFVGVGCFCFGVSSRQRSLWCVFVCVSSRTKWWKWTVWSRLGAVCLWVSQRRCHCHCQRGTRTALARLGGGSHVTRDSVYDVLFGRCYVRAGIYRVILLAAAVSRALFSVLLFPFYRGGCRSRHGFRVRIARCLCLLF